MGGGKGEKRETAASLQIDWLLTWKRPLRVYRGEEGGSFRDSRLRGKKKERGGRRLFRISKIFHFIPPPPRGEGKMIEVSIAIFFSFSFLD